MEGKSMTAKEKRPASDSSSSSKRPFFTLTSTNSLPVNLSLARPSPISIKTPKRSVVADNGVNLGIADDEVQSDTTSGRPKDQYWKIKRMLASRISSQKTRIKNIENVMEMEDKVRALETEIALMTSKIFIGQKKRNCLEVENKHLHELVKIHTHYDLIRDAEIAANKAELNKLRSLSFSLQQRAVHTGKTLVDYQSAPERAETMDLEFNQPLNHGLSQLNLIPDLNQEVVGDDDDDGWEQQSGPEQI